MLLLPDVSWCDWKMRERPQVDATEPLLPASFLPLAEERSTGFQALPLAQPQEGYPEPAPPKLEHLRNDGSHRWKNRAKTKAHSALAGVAQWMEHRPANQRVAGSIPSQVTCLGCRPGPRWGAHERQPHTDVSFPLFTPPSPSV